MTSRLKTLLIFLAILINLYFIDMLTINNNLGGGNGNPALVFIILLIPLLVYFSYFILKWVIKNIKTLLIRVLTIIVSSAILIFGFGHQKGLHRALKHHLIELSLQKRGEVHLDYIEEVTNGLTIFTNTIYFNYVTFAMFLSLILIIGVLIAIIMILE